MSFSKIVLMAVGLSGMVAQATEYTYKDPVFRVNNPAGSSSNNIAACVFTKTVGGEMVDSSWAEFSAATDGTLVKEGTGWITIDCDLSKFMGEIHAAAGILHIHHDLGLGNFLGGAGYVHAGATMYMHQRADGAILPNATPYDSYCKKELIFEGTGVEEIGAAVWFCSERGGESNWPMMRYPTLSGDATARVDKGGLYMNWRPASELRLNGHTLTLVGAPGQTRPQFRLNNIPSANGCVVVRNVKFVTTNDVGLPGGEESSLSLEDGAAYELVQGNGSKTWTLNYGASAYYWLLSPQNSDGYGYQVGDTNHQAWIGPVVLNSDLRLYNNCYQEPRVVSATEILTNAHHIGLNLHGPVSGDYGIRTFPGVQPRYRTDITLGLANPNNSFTGGVTFEGTNCTLALYANGALPAAGGAATLTNGAVHLVGNDVFELPDLNIGGTGLVQQASKSGGSWKTVTKTGPGDLVWNSCASADCFDIREGRLVLASTDNLDWAPFAGLRVSTNKCDKAADLGSFLPTDKITLRPDAAYNAKGWGFAGTTYTQYAYDGYIWNDAPTNEIWSFAMVMDKGGRLYIDDELIIDQTVRNEAKTANHEMTPGPHKFAFWYFCLSGNSGATGMPYGPAVFSYIDDEFFPTNSVGKHDNPAIGENGGCWTNNKGLVLDRQGRRTHNYSNYVDMVDSGNGKLFTFTTNLEDQAATKLPTFTKIAFGPQAGIDLMGWNVKVDELTGLPTIEHGDFTVTDKWKFSGVDVAAGGLLTTAGAFTLGPEATVEVTDFVGFPRENVTVIQAAGGLTIPASQIGKRLDAKGHFRLRQTSDTTLSLEYSAGTMLIFR